MTSRSKRRGAAPAAPTRAPRGPAPEPPPGAPPPLAERQRPGLSETLPRERRPDRCWSCGGQYELTRWEECDPWDRPSGVLVVLCHACAGRLIEPHARLYRSVPVLQPWPGAMALCLGCRHRDGVRCQHPALRANGGPGLEIRFPKPTVAHVNRGRRGSGFQALYHGPPTACAGQEPKEPHAGA